MQDMRNRLEEYGVDYKVTMERFMGNEALYIRILSKLGSDENAGKLKEAVEAGNLEEAFNAAHALKGVAANLGLTPLKEAASVILEPLRRREERDDYPALSVKVMEEFQKAVALTADASAGK